jgi:hypothetical protein
MVVSLLIPVLAIVVLALFGLYYFWDQRRWERETITKALRGEMERIKEALRGQLSWLDKSDSKLLPLVPFETVVHGAQLQRIGLLEPAFAEAEVTFYIMVHFINALQRVKQEYSQVDGGIDHFFGAYKKAIHTSLTGGQAS